MSISLKVYSQAFFFDWICPLHSSERNLVFAFPMISCGTKLATKELEDVFALLKNRLLYNLLLYVLLLTLYTKLTEKHKIMEELREKQRTDQSKVLTTSL